MAQLELEIQRENRPTETIRLYGERVLIGSEAYCDVRLHSDEAAPEHVVLDVKGQLLHVTAKSAALSLWLDGRRALRGTLASGGTLGLGRISIRIWIDRGAAGEASGGSGRRKLVAAALALAVIVLLGVALLSGTTVSKARPSAPPLWTKVSASCPTQRPIEALTAAADKAELAVAKAQRHPFIAREGVESVQLYRVAAECARVAGAQERSEALLASAETLQRTSDVDYRVRQLRLEYSLRIGDKSTAAREASMLRELIRGKDSPYSRWLAAVEKKLSRTASAGILPDLGGAAQ
jgi:hypothetical protein